MLLAYDLIVLLRYRNIDDVDKTMDEINEQTENMKQIADELAAPIDTSTDFDEAWTLNLFYSSIISLILVS